MNLRLNLLDFVLARSDRQFLRNRKTNELQTTFNTEYMPNLINQLSYTYIDRL